MRVNQYVAKVSGISRRKADESIRQGRVAINNSIALVGTSVLPGDSVTLNGNKISLPQSSTTILLNKPVSYVCSRDGQGSKTIYDLLPKKLHNLKPVGRLDKDSSGLLLLTNDGKLANQLTHPSFSKQKVYQVKLDKPLQKSDKQAIKKGIKLDDGISRLHLRGNETDWTVTMSEGRNRQIRRTFEKVGYQVTKLHRTEFGKYLLGKIAQSKYKIM